MEEERPPIHAPVPGLDGRQEGRRAAVSREVLWEVHLCEGAVGGVHSGDIESNMAAVLQIYCSGVGRNTLQGEGDAAGAWSQQSCGIPTIADGKSGDCGRTETLRHHICCVSTRQRRTEVGAVRACVSKTAACQPSNCEKRWIQRERQANTLAVLKHNNCREGQAAAPRTLLGLGSPSLLPVAGILPKTQKNNDGLPTTSQDCQLTGISIEGTCGLLRDYRQPRRLHCVHAHAR